MKALPENGSLVRFYAIDNFTGEDHEVIGRVISDARTYIDEQGLLGEQFAGVMFGEAIIVERQNGLKDLVFADFTVIEGPPTEMPTPEEIEEADWNRGRGE